MFQKFYDDTLIGRFIKRLLRASTLPLLSIIQHGDWIIEGCQYIFKNYIIEAKTSGQFCIDPDRHFGTGNVYYTDEPDIDEVNTDGKIRRASYKVICKYDPNNRQHSYSFHSRFMYYDPETHYHLGQYLRYIKTTTGLNLMPYYNCYCGKSISDVVIDVSREGGYVFSEESENKILLVPVKYGKTYTLALDCRTSIAIQPILYHEDGGLVMTSTSGIDNPQYYSNEEAFKEAYKSYSAPNFLQPLLFNVPPATNLETYQQERNLYLAIQVPKDYIGGLVALEGDYVNTWAVRNGGTLITSIDSSAMQMFDTLDPAMCRNLTLLHFNSKANIAFSDRLVEYLLLGVITPDESLDGNITYLQTLLEAIYPDKKYPRKGIWDESLRILVNKYVQDNASARTIRDLDGYLNRDIEQLMLGERRS